MAETFYCGGCGKHKPIAALGVYAVAGKSKCNTCIARIKKAVAQPSRAKWRCKQKTELLRENVDEYMACLNLK